MTLAQLKSIFTFTPDQLETGKAGIAKASIGGQFHLLADTFRDLGRSGTFDQYGHIVPTVMDLNSLDKRLHLLSDVYSKETEAHIRLAGLCGLSWKAWCAIILGLIAAGLALSLIWAGAATAAALIAAAAAIGITIGAALAAQILQTIVVAAGLISVICGALI
jgi:hypothetical protein